MFTGCHLLHQQSHAQTAAPRPRPVMVGGRRVTTIDIHAHVIVPEAEALMGIKTPPADASVIEGARVADRFQRMDEWRTDMQALSIRPIWYSLERDLATKVINLQNEKLAALCAAHPDRFVAFASVALQYPELAAEQLEEGVKKYNLRGAGIAGHVNGDELSARKFDPFWKKAEELDCLVFMHPQGIPELDKRLAGGGYLSNVIGNPLETTIFLSHLIFDGTLDRFPGLKICASHAGGYLPSYAGAFRLRLRPRLRARATAPKNTPRNICGNCISIRSSSLPKACAIWWPNAAPARSCSAPTIRFPGAPPPSNKFSKPPGLSDAERRAILGETAARLLKIKV